MKYSALALALCLGTLRAQDLPPSTPICSELFAHVSRQDDSLSWCFAPASVSESSQHHHHIAVAMLSEHGQDSNAIQTQTAPEHNAPRTVWDNISWSPWIAAGWGWPQGVRAELGLHIGRWGGIAFALSSNDVWSSHPNTGMFCFMATLNMPFENLPYVPYLFGNHGQVFKLFGGSDSYSMIGCGALIPLHKAVAIRPEFAVDFCSKYLYGGPGLFGSSGPEVDENVTRISLHCALEADLLAFIR